jgi:hypothetical protein
MHDGYSRTEKESHLDTIHYELSMLNFCGKELDKLSRANQRASFNVFLECFLLHYRNVMEFLSGAHHRKAKKQDETSDLSTADPKPWAGRELSAEELAEIQAPANTIDDKYFQDISQYLQHCTERRFDEGKFWNYREMFTELLPAIRAFLQRFPARSGSGVEVPTLGNGGSTATITYHEWSPGLGNLGK